MNRFFFIIGPLLLLLVLSTVFEARAEVRAIRRAQDGRRMALVIGNGAYSEFGLKNPVNDARDMAKVLGELGFKVTRLENADRRAMQSAISDFGLKLEGAKTGLFYYAGHGLQVNGRNFLLPVDAKVKSKADVEYEAVDAGRVLAQMREARAEVNIVILDACRNNPYRSLFRSAGPQGLATLSASKGTLIAYATAPGMVAADGAGRNSPYTKHLLREMKTSKPIEMVFKTVRERVMAETGNEQVPWEASSLVGGFYFVPAKAGEEAGRPAEAASDKETVFWETTVKMDDPQMYQAYLDQYPDGAFAALARVRLKNLAGDKPAAPALTTIGAMEVGQVGWAGAKAVVVGSDKRVWLLRSAGLKEKADADHTVMVSRTDKGYAADISRAGRKWKKSDPSPGEVVSVSDLATR